MGTSRWVSTCLGSSPPAPPAKRQHSVARHSEGSFSTVSLCSHGSVVLVSWSPYCPKSSLKKQTNTLKAKHSEPRPPGKELGEGPSIEELEELCPRLMHAADEQTPSLQNARIHQKGTLEPNGRRRRDPSLDHPGLGELGHDPPKHQGAAGVKSSCGLLSSSEDGFGGSKAWPHSRQASPSCIQHHDRRRYYQLHTCYFCSK